MNDPVNYAACLWLPGLAEVNIYSNNILVTKHSIISSSSMDDASQALITTNRRRNGKVNGGGGADDEDNGDYEEECRDVEVWETLSKSFNEVRRVLDHNRHLIQQVNENQQSLVPRNLSRNVELIREINENITRVIGLYSDLSTNFTSLVQQRRASRDASGDALVSKN